MKPAFRVVVGVLWLGFMIVFVVVAWREGVANWPFYLFMVPGYGSAGAFLAARRPRNPVGWLLLAAAVLGGLSLMFPSWVNAWQVAFPLMAGLFGIFLLVFPDGTLPSRRWRPIVALVGLGCSGLTLFAQPPEFAVALFVLSLLACALAPLIRYRHGGYLERLQIRWLALAVGVAAGSGITSLLVYQLGGTGVVQEISALTGLFALTVGIPASIAVAILRYQLFEIDRVLSRTVSYTLVVGFLAVVFFAVVTALTAVLPAESDLAVAGSTLAVAALFNPGRRRIQRWVDRHFNRSRYDAENVMDDFSGSLRGRVDPDGVVEGWVGVVSETMQPTTLAVWVKG